MDLKNEEKSASSALGRAAPPLAPSLLDDDELSNNAAFTDVSAYLYLIADVVTCCPTSYFIPRLQAPCSHHVHPAQALSSGLPAPH